MAKIKEWFKKIWFKIKNFFKPHYEEILPEWPSNPFVLPDIYEGFIEAFGFTNNKIDLTKTHRLFFDINNVNNEMDYTNPDKTYTLETIDGIIHSGDEVKLTKQGIDLAARNFPVGSYTLRIDLVEYLPYDYTDYVFKWHVRTMMQFKVMEKPKKAIKQENLKVVQVITTTIEK